MPSKNAESKQRSSCKNIIKRVNFSRQQDKENVKIKECKERMQGQECLNVKSVRTMLTKIRGLDKRIKCNDRRNL